MFSLVSYRFYATNLELAIANCYYVGSCVYPDQFADVDPAKEARRDFDLLLGRIAL